MSKITKTTRTFTISDVVWYQFKEVANEMGLNRSKWIENHMKELIKYKSERVIHADDLFNKNIKIV